MRMACVGASLRRVTPEELRERRHKTAGSPAPGTRRSQPGTVPIKKPRSDTVYAVVRPFPWRISRRTSGRDATSARAALRADWLDRSDITVNLRRLGGSVHRRRQSHGALAAIGPDLRFF